jgi:hypothetical protein
MEGGGSDLPSNVLWTIFATSLASLALLFVGLYFGLRKKGRGKRRQGRSKSAKHKPAGRKEKKLHARFRPGSDR